MICNLGAYLQASFSTAFERNHELKKAQEIYKTDNLLWFSLLDFN